MYEGKKRSGVQRHVSGAVQTCTTSPPHRLPQGAAKTSVKDIVESAAGTERPLLDALLAGDREAGAVTTAAYVNVLASLRPALVASLSAAFAAAGVEAILYPPVLATACLIAQARGCLAHCAAEGLATPASPPIDQQASEPACSLDVAGESLPIDTVYGRNVAVATAVRARLASLPVRAVPICPPLPSHLQTGFPALTIPVGAVHDLPVAVEILGAQLLSSPAAQPAPRRPLSSPSPSDAGLPGADVRLLELGQAIQGLYTHGGLAPPKLSAATFK